METEYCPDCQEKTHFFTSGRAVFLYEEEIRKSVYQFKFHNKREYAGFYVSEMERVGGDEIRNWNPDVIIPIPMYKRKKRQRGYNQAEILAKYLGKRLQIPVDTKSLVRVRKTIPQTSLGRKEREINLTNAVKTSTNALELMKVLRVDDFYTTGVTMDEAAKVLWMAGAEEVHFLVLCTGKPDC